MADAERARRRLSVRTHGAQEPAALTGRRIRSGEVSGRRSIRSARRANALRYVAGGGSITYTGFNVATNTYARETRDAALLVRTSTAPIAYERRLADGGREIYSQSNGATTNPRRVFLSQVVDPAGNSVTLKYDSQLRLTSITDAVGRTTTFFYAITSRPLLLTRITDPFNRSALIDYDSNGAYSGACE